MKILVTGALPHELRPFLKHLKPQRQLRAGAFRVTQTTYLSHEIMLAVTGIGIQNAEEAVRSVLDAFNADFLLSIGFAGALSEGVRIGDLVAATSVSLVSANSIKKIVQIPDERRLRDVLGGNVGARAASFFTLEKLMEKKAVRHFVPGDAAHPVCEMETFPLAVIALEKQIPFLAVRSITDLADEEIPPEFVELADRSGRHQFVRAAGLLLRKPRLIPMAVKVALRSGKAAKHLWLAFDALAHAL
ncbi:MAG TPA: hypothetical protein VKF36_02765 [Syntrophorhabdales bacterium]|nr:hypothetical protein [Syntrophorhabdales bacterium]